jgi:hypothetical protein
VYRCGADQPPAQLRTSFRSSHCSTVEIFGQIPSQSEITERCEGSGTVSRWTTYRWTAMMSALSRASVTALPACRAGRCNRAATRPAPTTELSLSYLLPAPLHVVSEIGVLPHRQQLLPLQHMRHRKTGHEDPVYLVV